jgi:predicted XRE-type DNA-binding protein
MPRKNRLKVTPSTGNVFRDLGFSDDEVEHLVVRADLLIQLQKALTARRLTQAKAATILRVTQPRVSDLLPKIARFTDEEVIKRGLELRRAAYRTRTMNREEVWALYAQYRIEGLRRGFDIDDIGHRNSGSES